MAADVGRAADCERMAAETVERFGGIDVLCANAGVFPDAKLEDMTEEDIDAIFATNVKGTMLSVKACMPALERSGHGRVVLTSSITGPITGYPGWSPLRRDEGRPARLPAHRRDRARRARASRSTRSCPATSRPRASTSSARSTGRRWSPRSRSGKLGTVEDIGFAALFLATDEASYITGQTIVVDGGQVLPESMMALEAM